MTSDQTDLLTYHLLRAALNRYDKTPNDLSESDRQTVTVQARKEFAIENRVLSSDEAKHVTIPETIVNDGLKNIQARYSSFDTFVEDLESNGLDQEALRSAIERELRVEAVLDRVASRAVPVSDVDARIYYFMHPERFYLPETRLARHILITINDQFPENVRKNVIERVGNISRRVKKKPHRFAEQAQKHSECPTAMNGGSLGRLSKGKLFPELDKALFDMHESEIRSELESPMGMHILHCEKIYKEGAMPLSEAIPKIIEKLSHRRRRICQSSWINQL